jgi:ABC-type transport system substrate-binding protein
MTLQPMAQIYQADLAKIGVNLMLKPTAAAVHVSMLSAKSFRGLATAAGSFGQMRPAVLLQGAYGPDVNNAGFEDDAYTVLVNQVLTETDPAKQTALYSRLNDYILDQSFTMPVTQNPPHLAARTNVRGLFYNAHEALELADVWVAS